MKSLRSFRLAASMPFIAAQALAACDKLSDKPHEVQLQHEAGVVNLAVTMVAPWGEYATVLAPGFQLDGAGALNKVIPRTSIVEEKLIDALAVTARAGLPRSSTSETRTTTETDGKTTTEAKRIDSREPGTLPEETEPATKTAASGLPGIKEADRTLSEEPMLEYAAAAALYQEVQLLNRYVLDAAQRHNMRPYVVRLQINLAPYARNQPYDTYATLAFFPSQRASDDQRKSAEKFTKVQNYRATAIPLLVTDSLEGTLKSRTADTVRQLALALGVLAKGVAVEAGISRQVENLNSVLGTDLNSLFTVGRVTDNTIFVRLGAARQPTAKYAMVPRSHNVTVLLLVDEAAVKETAEQPLAVRVVGHMTLRHAETGKTVPTRAKTAEDEEIVALLQHYDPKWKPAQEIQDKLIDDLFTNILVNDFPAFRENLTDNNGSKRFNIFAREIWLRMTEVLGRREFAGASFQLPAWIKPELPSATQAAVIDDNTETGAKIRLSGGQGLAERQYTATLSIARKEGAVVDLEASAIQVEPGGRSLLLSFPSLAALKLGELNETNNVLSGSRLTVMDRGGRWTEPKDNLAPGIYRMLVHRVVRSAPEGPGFMLRPTTSTIVTKEGDGEIKLFLEFDKQDEKPKFAAVEIVVANADVKSIKVEAPATYQHKLGKITVSGDTPVTLALGNLVGDTKVAIRAQAMKGGKAAGGAHPPIEISVAKAK